MNIIAEGKTKQILEHQSSKLVIVQSKDDITAGDGAKHDTVGGKAVWATTTTLNSFMIVAAAGVPLSFVQERDSTSFIAERCDMLPFEVVARGKVWGSYLKRQTGARQGDVFDPPLVEFFLKTNGRKWGMYDLPCDDPYMAIRPDGTLALYEPNKPFDASSPFLVLRDWPLCDEPMLFNLMQVYTEKTFLALKDAWADLGVQLIDLKVEFGFNQDGELRLSDVIDNDSWRILDENGENLDKQIYRDGGDLPEVFDKYQLVAELSNRLMPLY